MSSPLVEWHCPRCQSTIADRRKHCTTCHSMLRWTCIGSGRSGIYTHFFRHRDNCIHCTSEMEDKPQQVEEKQIAIQQLRNLNNEQRPWSEWDRSDQSCIHHTWHDIEQIHQLYSICEQSLINYCLHRTKQQSDNVKTSSLSPMNLLVVTLWYLKHYHSERYIATEVYLSPSTIHRMVTEIVDILHSCVYSELVSLPIDMESSNTAHEPEEHHKIIVDSTSIAVPRPDDSEQRKAYFHSKSATNYAIKVQIACDFNHRIVHVSECYRGSVHDITILRESGLLEHVNDSVQIIADKAYVGEEFVITPKGKSYRRELTTEDKSYNYDINRARAAIEIINQRIKTYAILGSIYRGTINDFDKITKISQVVCALCNLNLVKHPIRK
ncbi:unnamed protein product [Rotaria magnacalcarata]|uniref:Transposase n=1 Tax=Rotaria magnacalcarata TaxID=392030 RepID=A0A816MS44_9BILA|nr:unnamed protein product [Rotaria magnacalcarata]CAF4093221.1 unnamed protein product [Rotaria magnacalcarata]